MVRDEELGRELAQEALLQAYLSLQNLRHEASFSGWLYGIVLNVCRDHFRQHQANVLSLEALAGGVSFERLPFSAAMPSPLPSVSKRPSTSRQKFSKRLAPRRPKQRSYARREQAWT